MNNAMDNALSTLDHEYQQKRAELLRIQRDQANQLEQAAHLESIRQAEEAVQAARQAELAWFDEMFVVPTKAEFEQIDAKAKNLNARIESLVDQIAALVPEQQALAERLVVASHNTGKRAQQLSLRPLRRGGTEFDEAARSLWSELFSTNSVWNQPIQATGFGFATSGKKFPSAERLLMRPDQTARLTPAPTSAVPAVQAFPQKVQAAPTAKRTSYPVETWVAEHATVGQGRTEGSVAYTHYKKCCESLGVAPVTNNEFASELADLFVEKKRSSRGVSYTLTLKQ